MSGDDHFIRPDNDVYVNNRNFQPERGDYLMQDHEQKIMDEIEREVSNITKIAQIRPAIPVTPPPEPSIEDVGKMAADAVLQVYESTAKHLEEMGNEVKDRIKRLAEALAEADADLKWLAEAATAIRTKGEAVRGLVENASNRSHQIREMVERVKGKLED